MRKVSDNIWDNIQCTNIRVIGVPEKEKKKKGTKKIFEETIVENCHGTVVFKLKDDVLHYCDECQYNDCTCGFKVGDQVITDDGRVGVIESICDCESCKDRGFYEPRVKMQDGYDQIWITDTDKKTSDMRPLWEKGEKHAK